VKINWYGRGLPKHVRLDIDFIENIKNENQIKMKTQILNRVMVIMIITLTVLSSCSKKKTHSTDVQTETSDTTKESTISVEPTDSKTVDESKNWDKFLEDYEDYVDSYLKLYEKAKKGDQSAVAEYPALMQKANDLQQSITEAQQDNKLSAEQLTKFANIQNKMLQAISK